MAFACIHGRLPGGQSKPRGKTALSETDKHKEVAVHIQWRNEMRDLTHSEVEQIGGGSLAGDIMMTLAAGWAGTVAGFGVGMVVPGPGNLAGALTGFAIGSLVGIGYALADDDRQYVNGGSGGW